KSTGASKSYVVNLQKEFIEEYAWKALKGGALYEGEYPLATAIGRPLLAKLMVEIAEKENANMIAHGCTGKGNDQVRFEVGMKTLNPDVEILAPLREWEFKSREEEIIYADIDLDEIIAAKRMFDVSGHYSRPDVFKYSVIKDPLK
ncbi:MAG: argininosuccinate synthase, partial [Candidatus Aminicenantes bacterium]|nr:argininosuccinate synthase [Candidatus Aminicenantes bacterium]